MSRRHKHKARTTLKLAPLPAVVLEAALAGETVKNFEGSDAECLAAQTAAGRRWLAELIIQGVDADGFVRDQVALSFGEETVGDIEGVDTDEGRRTHMEAVEPALARSVQWQADQMRQRGLRPHIRFRLRDAIANDPERLAQVRAELGTESCEALRWRDGYHGAEILSLRPGKNRNVRFSLLRELFGSSE